MNLWTEILTLLNLGKNTFSIQTELQPVDSQKCRIPPLKTQNMKQVEEQLSIKKMLVQKNGHR